MRVLIPMLSAAPLASIAVAASVSFDAARPTCVACNVTEVVALSSTDHKEVNDMNATFARTDASARGRLTAQRW
jgi:hypothetical protein